MSHVRVEGALRIARARCSSDALLFSNGSAKAQEGRFQEKSTVQQVFLCTAATAAHSMNTRLVVSGRPRPRRTDAAAGLRCETEVSRIDPGKYHWATYPTM